MELPHLGRNCALKQCNRLDFLPVKCDACSQVFCIDHYKYEGHTCPSAACDTSNQVPMCPLCSQPVPNKPGQLPDIAVSEHMDRYCRRNDQVKNPQAPASQLQACCYKACRRKDIIYLECSECLLKFCIKHRHPTDHTCTGPPAGSRLKTGWQSMKDSYLQSASSAVPMSGLERLKSKASQMTKSGQAALRRIAGESSASTTTANHRLANGLQGGLSEQEALAIALRESQVNSGQASGTQEDEALARALHESQLEAARSQQSGRQQATKDSCIVC